MPALCRDCLHTFDAPAPRCPSCGRRRVVTHPELFDLSIAHMDCDAFYASVEKRDNPALRDLPVIVGGGQRGVVTTACYIARIRGVRSAMPMFQARRLCPEAVVIAPRFDRYREASQAIRAMMDVLTPVVEPLSLDEAFLDMSGTARLHGAPPAVMLAGLVRRMETELGLSGSIGLSHNKFLAKLASEMDKPRGFSVIGEAETLEVLAPMPVAAIWGVGAVSRAALERAGIRTIGDLRRWEQRDLAARFGAQGLRLWHLARGEDRRSVQAARPEKSISNEVTFLDDHGDVETLEAQLWVMAEKVSARAKARDLAGRVATLKVKRADHRVLTRRVTLHQPTQMAERLFAAGRELLAPVLPEGPFRLLGVGLSDLVAAERADLEADLFDPGAAKRDAAERARDAIRAKFGRDAITKGRALGRSRRGATDAPNSEPED